MTDPSIIRSAAQRWLDGGLSVLPIAHGKTKRPPFNWARFQTERATEAHLDLWFGEHPGIGVVCGEVSGNLEMTELEGRATSTGDLLKVQAECDLRGVGNLWRQLTEDGYCEISPSGGMHLLYRIVDQKVPGNTPIARRPSNEAELADNPKSKVKVLAETRGEGGFVVVAPTPGSCHESGQPWSVVSGELGVIPTITWEQRNLLHEAIHAALDEMPVELVRAMTPPRERTASDAVLPGHDFNARADWSDTLLLGGAGWTQKRHFGGEVRWTKPGGSKDKHHATTGREGTGELDRLYVFSSETEFPTETPLSKFAVYAELHHNGDFNAAAKALAGLGYGERRDFSRVNQAPVEFGAWTPEPHDEPLEQVKAAFDTGIKGVTARPLLPTPQGVYDYTNSGAVARFASINSWCIRYVTEEKIWRIWDGVAWRADETGVAVSRAFEHFTEVLRDECARMEKRAEDSEDKKLEAQVKSYHRHIQKLRDSSRTTILSLIATWVSVSAETFDADPRYFNLRNGVYDMVADKFLPHDPKFLLTKVAGADFDPDAEAPDSVAFLESVLPNPAMREFTIQALSDALTGEADRKAFFVLQGMSNSGKTQVLELAQTLFGDYAVPVSPGAFARRQNPGAPTPELHEMRGARFIFTSETSHELQLDEEMVKRFTGKDTMTTRTLYQKPQRWVPQGTVWVATNNLPRFSADEEAMWRRVKTIRFTNTFTDDGSSGQLAVPNIGRTLAAKEASGLLNLLLSALRRLRAAGRLTEPQELKDSVSEHRLETDPLARFITEAVDSQALEDAPGFDANQNQVYQEYKVTCEFEGVTPLGPQRFGRALKQHLKRETRRSNNVTWIIGMRWNGFSSVARGPANMRSDE